MIRKQFRVLDKSSFMILYKGYIRYIKDTLRCGGICNDLFIANFLLSVTVKEFLKNVPNSLKYPAEYIAYFLGRLTSFTSRFP